MKLQQDGPDTEEHWKPASAKRRTASKARRGIPFRRPAPPPGETSVLRAQLPPRSGKRKAEPVRFWDGSLLGQLKGMNAKSTKKQRSFVESLNAHSLDESRKSVERVRQRGSDLALNTGGLELDVLDTIVQMERLGENSKSYGTYESHWKLWMRFCDQLETSYWRHDESANSGRDKDGYAVEVTLMSAALIYALTEMKGQGGGPAKPGSAQNFLRSIRKLHEMRNVTMVPISAVKAVFKGSMRRHATLYGMESLLPKQKQPFHKVHVHRMLSFVDGTKLGNRVYRKNSTWCRSWDAYVATSASTGFRKSETVMCHEDGTPLTRAHVSWIVNGVAKAHLTREEMLALTEDDYVVIRPPASKADPFARVGKPSNLWGIYCRQPHK